MVDIGRLSRRFTIQTPTKSQNAFGEVEITWSNLCKRWGSLRATTGTDRINASQVSSEVTHQVILRRDSSISINADWRLASDNRVFDIVHVFDQDDGDRYWTLEVSEVVS